MLFENPDNAIFSHSNFYLSNFTRNKLEAVDIITVAVMNICELLLPFQLVPC